MKTRLIALLHILILTVGILLISIAGYKGLQ